MTTIPLLKSIVAQSCSSRTTMRHAVINAVSRPLRLVWDSFTADNEDYSLLTSSLLLVSCGTLTFVVLQSIIRYRKAIHERLRQVKEDSLLFGSGMVRCTHPQQQNVAWAHFLQLNPDFQRQHQDRFHLVSLGECLSSLRPANISKDMEISDTMQQEIEATVASAILKALGPLFGPAVLPTLGTCSVGKRMDQLAASMASLFLISSSVDPTIQGAIPMTLFTLSAVSAVNEKASRIRHEQNATTLSPLEKMQIGEVGIKPSFNLEIPENEELLIPNPFIVSQHWERAISGMEARMDAQDKPNYNPEDKSMPIPTPVNERLLPGLFYGWGVANCTHTKREIVRNRLMSVLLNRLGRNYFYYSTKENVAKETLICLKISEFTLPIYRPSDFVKALMDCGHDIRVGPRTHLTTFGVALCIQEEDGTWSNVPIAYFLESDYENKNGEPAYACLPHGGLNLDMTGPLVDEGASSCNIQHFLSINGMCGWNSDHNGDVPWLESIPICEPWRGKDAVRAVRLAALSAVVTNAVGTEDELPFGGYGLTGACNDSAALIEKVMRGTTNIYPLMTSGRYMTRIVRRMNRLRDAFVQHNDPLLREDTKALDLLMEAAVKMRSDLLASPTNAADSTRRMLICLPKGLPFKLLQESKRVLEDIKAEFDTYPLNAGL